MLTSDRSVSRYIFAMETEQLICEFHILSYLSSSNISFERIEYLVAAPWVKEDVCNVIYVLGQFLW